MADASAMEMVFCDPEVMEFGDGAQNPEWVERWLSGTLERHYKKHGYGLWAVVEKQRRETIGYTGLSYFSDINGKPEIEIGYRFARSAWGRGYATEAALAVRDYAFDTLRIERLIALIDPSNLGSARVAEKLGMTHESKVMLEGYTHPDYVYVVEYPVGG